MTQSMFRLLVAPRGRGPCPGVYQGSSRIRLFSGISPCTGPWGYRHGGWGRRGGGTSSPSPVSHTPTTVCLGVPRSAPAWGQCPDVYMVGSHIGGAMLAPICRQRQARPRFFTGIHAPPAHTKEHAGAAGTPTLRLPANTSPAPPAARGAAGGTSRHRSRRRSPASCPGPSVSSPTRG